ncbi:MAG: HU family DNA-binding protein [Holdemanella sp.]|nr:HU family DNA-binding protein [Holdemanella sp.]
MAKFVNKESLTQTLTEQLNLSKRDARNAVDLIFNEMSEALIVHGEIDISGFGKFEIFDRKERMGINPNTQEKIIVPSSNLPKFKASQTLKNKCNRK